QSVGDNIGIEDWGFEDEASGVLHNDMTQKTPIRDSRDATAARKFFRGSNASSAKDGRDSQFASMNLQPAPGESWDIRQGNKEPARAPRGNASGDSPVGKESGAANSEGTGTSG